MVTSLAGHKDKSLEYFDYEISLFKERLMRKPEKAVLRNLILTQRTESVEIGCHIVDGGALLHKVHWQPNITYLEVLQGYVRAVRKMYGQCHVVFDGYDSHSTKDHEHMRRDANMNKCDIMFTKEMKVRIKREEFLINNKNKCHLIKMLKPMLEADSQEVSVSNSDADVDIVRTALKVISFNHEEDK